MIILEHTYVTKKKSTNTQNSNVNKYTYVIFSDKTNGISFSDYDNFNARNKTDITYEH